MDEPSLPKSELVIHFHVSMRNPVRCLAMVVPFAELMAFVNELFVMSLN